MQKLLGVSTLFKVQYRQTHCKVPVIRSTHEYYHSGCMFVAGRQPVKVDVLCCCVMACQRAKLQQGQCKCMQAALKQCDTGMLFLMLAYLLQWQDDMFDHGRCGHRRVLHKLISCNVSQSWVQHMLQHRLVKLVRCFIHPYHLWNLTP